MSTFDYKIHYPKAIKVIDFEKYDYNKKFMFDFRDKDSSMTVFIFHKDTIFNFTRCLVEIYVSAKLNDVTINADAPNDDYFMLMDFGPINMG